MGYSFESEYSITPVVSWDSRSLQEILHKRMPTLFVFGKVTNEEAEGPLGTWRLEARDENRLGRARRLEADEHTIAVAEVQGPPFDTNLLSVMGTVGHVATRWVSIGCTSAGLEVIAADLRMKAGAVEENQLHGTFALQRAPLLGT